MNATLELAQLVLRCDFCEGNHSIAYCQMPSGS